MVYVLFITVGLATLLHTFIFYLETIAWTSPLARKTFGLTKQESTQTQAMAANQGVYNLLLAVIALVGLVLYALGHDRTGLVLVLAGCGSMTTAALYLFFSSNKKSAAMKQLSFPALATIVACILLTSL